MNALHKVLRPVIIIVFLVLWVSVNAQQPSKYKYKLPAITCTDAKMPLTLGNINYKINKTPEPIVVKKITRILINFYEDNNGDTSEEFTKIKDAYFRTIRLPYNNCELYAVILKTPVSDDSHCVLFLYDPAKNEVSKRTIDLYIWALYDISNDKLVPSNLKTQFHLSTTEIDASGTKGDQLLTLRWLRHNGTFNAIEEAIYRQNDMELDSVSFRERVLN